ncbi:MAG TPA: hypothetical protein VMU54_24735, partial [Planctomycetota bacterium]|nr:hypothetical protein [Planctomycetota bacterium]
GKPAVVCRLVDGGEVIFVTTSVDALWTDWPLRHTYLPFVHVALSHLLDSPTAAHNVVAGEPLQWRPPAADGDKMFFATDPDGKRLRLGVPSMIEGQPLVTVEETPRAGAYRILKEKAPEESGALFAVTPDLRESEDLTALTDREIDERLGFGVTHVTAGDDLSALSGSERLKREWSLWILSLVAVIVGVETVLAWYCGKGW